MAVSSTDKEELEKIELMWATFDVQLQELLSRKNTNNVFVSDEKYQSLVKHVKELKSGRRKKQPQDYHLLKRYDIVLEASVDKLIFPRKEGDEAMRYYVSTSEIFEVLHDTHIKVNHGGRNRMLKELSSRYKNITTECIMMYLNLCHKCQKKLKPKRARRVDDTTSRCHIELIDMQSREFDGYKWVVVYQDHATKFVHLQASKTRNVTEVAELIFDVVSVFGVPAILQSTIGTVFVSSVIERLQNKWVGIRLVYGASEEKTPNEDLDMTKELILEWMNNTSSPDWPQGLRFVQMMRNNIVHSDLNCSPFETMFGHPMSTGFTSSLPLDLVATIKSEEDFRKIIEQGSACTEVEEYDQSIDQGHEGDLGVDVLQSESEIYLAFTGIKEEDIGRNRISIAGGRLIVRDENHAEINLDANSIKEEVDCLDTKEQFHGALSIINKR